MIRPSKPEDLPTLVHLAETTGVFKPLEIEALREVLEELYKQNYKYDHRAIVLMDQDHIVGFAYFAPADMTVGTWHLYWIAVGHTKQTRGLGSKLLHEVEEQTRSAGGRVLFIETSSQPQYEKTRRFYAKHGYDREAVLRDFYAEGDDMVIFRKKL